MIYCDAASCLEPATHHVTGPSLSVHACEQHFASMHILVPHAGEPMSVAKRALVDALEGVVEMRTSLDGIRISPRDSYTSIALSILEALTERPNTRELLHRYLEEMT